MASGPYSEVKNNEHFLKLLAQLSDGKLPDQRRRRSSSQGEQQRSWLARRMSIASLDEGATRRPSMASIRKLSTVFGHRASVVSQRKLSSVSTSSSEKDSKRTRSMSIASMPRHVPSFDVLHEEADDDTEDERQENTVVDQNPGIYGWMGCLTRLLID